MEKYLKYSDKVELDLDELESDTSTSISLSGSTSGIATAIGANATSGEEAITIGTGASSEDTGEIGVATGSTAIEIGNAFSHLDFLHRDLKNDNIFLIETKSYRDKTSNLLEGRDVVLNESWDKVENVNGKVVSIYSTKVEVDCLIDPEKNHIVSRRFPKELFTHLANLKKGLLVIIKLKIRPGSSRIDVYSGKGVFDPSPFEQKERWSSLMDSGLDRKLAKW